MCKRLLLIVSMLAFIMFFACQAAEESKTQTAKEALQTPQESAAKAARDSRVRKMAITGKIAKGRNNYIIRGKKPAEVFTILNPDPAILDEFAESEKTVQIDARIVSGDNVTIEVLDGKEYTQEIQ